MGGSFWDRIAGLYDLAERSNHRAVRGMIRAITERIPPDADMLECAAGTGEISLAAAPRARSVLCTDASLPMLDRARRKARKLGLTNVTFAQRDLYHLPEPDGRFDAVVAANVLHLLDRPEAAVGELWRVTRPGGLVILPTFLQGEAGWGFRQVIRAYRLVGFQFQIAYTRRSYREMIDGCRLGAPRYLLVKGRLPVGLAVLTKS